MSQRVFTYHDALATFPQVREITNVAVRQIEAMVSRLQSRDEMESRREELEATYKAIVEAWTDEVAALGCEVRGLWRVDWDNGDGYYSWSYPEEALGHFHGYEDDFQRRMPVN